jgi:hypothetical protein
MDALSRVACGRGGRVLEVGYGLGLSSRCIDNRLAGFVALASGQGTQQAPEAREPDANKTTTTGVSLVATADIAATATTSPTATVDAIGDRDTDKLSSLSQEFDAEHVVIEANAEVANVARMFAADEVSHFFHPNLTDLFISLQFCVLLRQIGAGLHHCE